MEMNFVLPTRIVTGNDCVIKNATLFAEYGKKCIVVTGKSSAKKSGALDDVTKALREVDTEFCIFDGIEQNPSYESCKKASLIAIDFGAEFVIGIGGGSPLDAAKAVAVLATDKSMDEKTMYSSVWEKTPLPIVCIGTTAGTGSEVTPVSVITNSSGMKKSFRAVTTFPKLSFGDAKYTLSLSRNFTRSTAIDALCHCVESYFNRTANELSQTFAVRGVQILCEMLEKTATDEELSYDDREKLYCASLYGGLAISVTGTAFPHAFGYFLTENHSISHGNACGAYLPEFLEYNAVNAKELSDSFFGAVGISKEEFCRLVIKNLPGQEASCGVRLSKEQINELLPRYENNASLKKCYGTADAALAKEILSKLFLA